MADAGSEEERINGDVAAGHGHTVGLDDLSHPPWVKSLSEFFRFESKEIRSVGDSFKNNRQRVFYNLRCTLCEHSNGQSKRCKRNGGDPAVFNGNSTTAFVRHLKRSHEEVDISKITNSNEKTSGSYKRKYAEEEDDTSIIPSVIGVTGKSSKDVLIKKYEDSSVKQKLFRKHCLDWMVRDGVPLSSTEKKGFRKLIFSLDDRLNCPSRSTMMTLLDEKHKQILEHLRIILRGLRPGTAHLILDIWSSRQKLSVIGVQVRFIKDWKLHQYVLGFQHFPGSHDAKSIKKKLEDLLTITYGFSMTDFLTVTADNASAILLAFKETSYQSPPPISSVATSGLESGTDRGHDDPLPASSFATDNEDLDELPDIDNATIEHELVTDEEINSAIDNVISEWSTLKTTEERRSRNSCLAHLLQLAIKDALNQEEVASIIKKVNAIITWFHKSNKYYTALRELSGLALVKPCETRWNSTYHCLKRLTREIIIKGKEDESEETFATLVNKSLSEARKTTKRVPLSLSLEEIQSLGTLLSLLEPFSDLTNTWQSNGITSSTVIYGLVDAVRELDNVITSHTESESDSEDHSEQPQTFLVKFRNGLRDSVLQRFGTDQESGQQVAARGRKIVTCNVVNDKYYVLATLLDPKLKTIPFEESFVENIKFSCGYPTKSAAIKLLKDTYNLEKQIIAAMDDVQILSDSQNQVPQDSRESTSGSPSQERVPKPKKMNLFERLRQHRAAVASRDKVIDEIEHYLASPTISEKENSLSFWRHNEDRFPILSKLALKYLSMPATSASVERLFSVGGSIISSRRSSMAIETAEKLILYKDYLLQGKIDLT